MNGNFTLSKIDGQSDVHDMIESWTIFFRTSCPWHSRARLADS